MFKFLDNLMGRTADGEVASASSAEIALSQGAAASADGVPTVQNSIWQDADSGAVREMLYFSPSAAGVAVTPETAMRVSAVYACVRIIAGSIASLPLHIYERTPEGRNKVDVPLWWLLNQQPTPQFSAAAWWEYVATSVLLCGDAFARIVRNKAMEIVEIVPLHPDSVIVEKKNGQLVYFIQLWDGEKIIRRGVSQEDMLHFPGFGFNGLRSLSVIRSAAQNAIGTAISADRFSGKFFANGAMPSFIFETEGKMDADKQRELRETFLQVAAGTDNAFKPFVLTQGMKAKEISLKPEDSQLMEARKFQVIDIARAFGVPAFMIGETEKTTSWGSGIEHMSLGYLKFTLQPHLTRWEQEINRKCFDPDRYFSEFNVSGLLRGDDKGRAEYFRQAIGGSQGPGWMTINEVRRLDNLPPIDGGNQIYDPKKGTNDVTPKTDATGQGQPGSTEGVPGPGRR